MDYFPAFFKLTGLPVLVVGGGEVAVRKVTLLERAGALITVVAPEVSVELAERAALGKLELRAREFVPADLGGMRMVVVATSRREINHWVASLSEARAIPVNVVDDRDASRFIVPAMIDRDPVLIAISTGGTSPVLARRLRERLEALIPKRFGELALWLRKLRSSAAERLRNTDERRRYFEALIDGPAAQRFVDGDARGAERLARQLLEAASNAPPPAGEVVLVGAGPGDPELLTLKALRALQDADVILYDRLVSAAVLDYARRDATRICVGKSAGGASVSQEDINRALIEHAAQGKRVVRLKGGDPFIFGRGGEELEALRRAGIAFSVIPGVTAALGCAAYAGIPLTHREHAHSVTFVTGHTDTGLGDVQWKSLAAPGATAVFYMALAHLERIVERLTAHGASSQRPAALIFQGTTAQQRVVTGTLATLSKLAAQHKLESPTLLVVGDVVSLEPALSWFGAAASAAASAAGTRAAADWSRIA